MEEHIKEISSTDGRLEIRFPYSAGILREVKSIPSARWDNGAGCWYFPRKPMYAKALLDFANRFSFDLDADVTKLATYKPIPANRDKLYDYQGIGVDFIHANAGTCLLADGMGLGKTLTALQYAKEIDAQSVLVVCPASVTYKWGSEREVDG